jgi:hypothetical protein
MGGSFYDVSLIAHYIAEHMAGTMQWSKLNTDWNADPNAPESKVYVEGDTIILEFYLNYFIYPKFKEGDIGRLFFYNGHKYSLGGTNDEGYFMGQHRYKDSWLPYGEFYQLDSNWFRDFPKDAVTIRPINNSDKLKHFIFFMKENVFECVAEDYKFSIVTPELK